MFLFKTSTREQRCQIPSLFPTLGMERERIDEAVQTILSLSEIKAELTNCIYLQDSSTELYGLKIYGTRPLDKIDYKYNDKPKKL